MSDPLDILRTDHPWIGLTGILRHGAPKSTDKHGIIVAIGQCGSTHESSCAYVGVVMLADDDTTDEGELAYFVPDDPTEARRRLTESAREWSGPDRWEHWIGGLHAYPDNFTIPLMAGYIQIGPWESVAYIQADVSDEVAGRDWRRPLRKVAP